MYNQSRPQRWLITGLTTLGLAVGGAMLPAVHPAAHASQQPATSVTKPANARISHGPVTNSNVKRPTVYSYHQAPQVGSNALIRGHQLHLNRARAAVAMDGRTGQVVYQKNADQRRLIASTGKLMTFYLAERKLARNPHAWHQKVGVSKAIVRMGRNPNFDSFHFVGGRRYSIRSIFTGAFVGSDCDAATRLGQWVGGNNHHFIQMMNKQARLWHLNAHFTSASGLENHDLAPYGFGVRGGAYRGNEVSARSLATITYHLIHDFPKIMKISRLHNVVLAHHNNHNYDNLLPGRRYYEKRLHTDGLKTGYTGAAGYCFVGTGKRPHQDRLITVILHDPTEFSDTDDLMNFVYQHAKLYRA